MIALATVMVIPALSSCGDDDDDDGGSTTATAESFVGRTFHYQSEGYDNGSDYSNDKIDITFVTTSAATINKYGYSVDYWGGDFEPEKNRYNWTDTYEYTISNGTIYFTCVGTHSDSFSVRIVNGGLEGYTER